MAFKLSSHQISIPHPHEIKQFKLLMILGVVVLVTVTIIYFGFFRSSSPSVTTSDGNELDDSSSPSTGTEDTSDLRSPEGVTTKINFDVNFLKESIFKDLEVRGNDPLEANEKGRNHPFLPF